MARGPVDAVALLGEPTRRALYEAAARAEGGITRDAAAQAAGTTRALAAFHLDKLVAAGLLEVAFKRLSGRTGPGAGRPSKLYRRGATEVAVSLPPRTYDLGAVLLADALATSRSRATRAALTRTARKHGRALADRAATASSRRARLEAALELLAAQGYEPELRGGDIRLRNCPFHALAGRHRELICGMNLALLEGVLEGLGDTGFTAKLAPEPGFCCVAFARRAR